MKRFIAAFLLVTASHTPLANDVGDAFIGMCDRVEACVREEMVASGDVSESVIEKALGQMRQQCASKKGEFEASIPDDRADEVVACFEAASKLDCEVIKSGEDPTGSLPACEDLEELMNESQ
ncbi:hypothetical protein [Luminiphilus syltensis]|uniref:hypothetical protein n=1 Tax=Luminiphilus syltensis TaxID=1341119 RepID=UPI0002FF3750|nr:hypothetical protein [Luminiphilus syltensis]